MPMQTHIIKLSDVQTHVHKDFILGLVKDANLPGLVTEMNYAQQQSQRGGACRCFFWSNGATFFGFSDRDDRQHAEEDCFRNMKDANFQLSRSSFWLMYVDLEPCHSKRYSGHNCRAYFDANAGVVDATTQGRFSLRHSQGGQFYPYLTNGIVLYAFSQTDVGEKSPSAFMHDKQNSADRFLNEMGVNPLEHNRVNNGIGYFVLGKNAHYVAPPNPGQQ